MGVARAGNLETVGLSNAQIVDGSLRFDGGKSQYLKRTPSSTGNRKTWTWSFWTKRSIFGETEAFFGAYTDSNNRFYPHFNSDNKLNSFGLTGGVTKISVQSNAVFRDTSWYHIVIVLDTTESSSSNKLKYYVNGSLQQTTVSTTPADDIYFNLTSVEHRIGDLDGSVFYDGYMSNVYFIDGQALDPSYFGYTDPLTNTWRPKKYVRTTTITGDTGSAVGFGTNGFWLPLDGNTPIGKDMSGKGNDWTPVNFGGSNTIEKATGALPILNTDGGGKVARVGVRTDSFVGVGATCVLALPLVGIKSDFSNKIDSRSTEKVVTATNSVASSTQSNFYGGSWYFDGTADSLAVSSSSDLTLGNTWTIEFWFYNAGSGGAADARLYYFHSNTNNLQTTTTGTQLLFYNGSSATTFGNINLNTWVHVAAVNSSGTVRFYINGVQNSSTTSAGTFSGNQALTIGAFSDGTSNCFTGYIQDFRIYNGLAKYTQNFIPASTDPDILPDTPSGVAYSSNVALVPSTDGAVAFDGSGDYLSIASNADFDFGSGDCTVECFLFISSHSGDKTIIGTWEGNISWQLSYGVTGSNDRFGFSMYNGSTTTASSSVLSTAYVGRWVHLAGVRNGNTLQIWVNGVLDGTASFSGSHNAVNTSLIVGGRSSGNQIAGFLSNVHIVKGTALYTSNFTPPTAPITSVANTKLLCCKSNSSATAFDVSPGTITANGNAAATNFNPFTVNINAVRGQESGYCTLNPNDKPSSASVTISNGNLRATDGNSGSYSLVVSNAGLSTSNTDTGYYLEVTNLKTTSGNSAYTGFSFWRVGGGAYNNLYPPGTATYNPNNGYTYSQNGGVTPWGGSTVSSQPTWQTAGDVFSVAVKGSNVWFAKNGIWISGNPATGTSPYTTIPSGYGQVFPAALALETGDQEFNFGQKPFKFPPPAGFQPLALANTPRPTIVRPDQYVGVTTFTGTGQGTTTTVSNLQFKPDFVWTKSRAGARNHGLYDSVRGINRKLYSSADFAENTGTTLTSFDRNGFKLADGDDIVYYGESGVAWCWKAGGNSNTFNINDIGYATASAAGLTAGTITPTGASVNTKSGFSIVTYNSGSTTGNFTVDHGLNAVPKFIIHKTRSTGNWWVYHASVIDDLAKYLQLNSTNAIATNSANMWGGAFPTSSVFGVRVGDLIGTSQNAIAYLWAEIPGFSKFGSYTGNGSTNGPMVVTGFRPRWLMYKSTAAGGNWIMLDAARDSRNVASTRLLANTSDSEGTGVHLVDFLSNGFKIRNDDTNGNTNAQTYIYAAFAETPSFNLYGGQSNAR